MSIKTTHNITREDALYIIYEVLENREISDEHLANILEEVIHNGFYNFRIESKEYIENDKNSAFPSPYLDRDCYIPEYNTAW